MRALDRSDETLAMGDHAVFDILNGFPIGVVVADSSGAPYFINSAAVLLLGEGADPAAPADVRSSVHPAFVAGTDEPYPMSEMPIVRALAGETSHIDDMEIRTADGTIAVEVWGRPLVDDETGSVDAVAVFADITERKRAESALMERTSELSRLNGELAQSNVELDQFAHVASHDLSEPLRAISGFVQLLARRYDGQLDAEADRFIRRTVEGTERMQTLISDILTYSAVGRASDGFSAVPCEPLVAAAVEALGVVLRERRAEVVVGVLPTVWGDGAQLTQVFQNLVANAVKFTPAGTEPCVEIGAEREGGFYQFSIRDNGIGIEPQYRDRIFRMFQRLNRREEYAGTGIGLAVCKKIVERHEGRIWVQGSPSGGADFRFTLPMGKRSS